MQTYFAPLHASLVVIKACFHQGLSACLGALDRLQARALSLPSSYLHKSPSNPCSALLNSSTGARLTCFLLSIFHYHWEVCCCQER